MSWKVETGLRKVTLEVNLTPSVSIYAPSTSRIQIHSWAENEQEAREEILKAVALLWAEAHCK